MRNEVVIFDDMTMDEILTEIMYIAPNLSDQQKIEHLLSVWDKYTPEQIESALP